MGRRLGILVLLWCLLGAWAAPADAHGGWRGGWRGGARSGVFLGLGFGLGYPGPFYGYPYYAPVVPPVYIAPPYYGSSYYGSSYYGPSYYGPSAYVAPPVYVGPPAYVGPQQAYVAPPAYMGPLGPAAQPAPAPQTLPGAQPGQAVQPDPALPPAQPAGTVGTAPYACQNVALAQQLGATDASGAPAAGGTIVAALVAGEAGRWFDLREQACIARALELAPPGHRVAWQALAAPTQFAVVAGAVERRGDRLCRSFEAEYATSGGDGARKAFGNACRRSDGVWLAAG